MWHLCTWMTHSALVDDNVSVAALRCHPGLFPSRSHQWPAYPPQLLSDRCDSPHHPSVLEDEPAPKLFRDVVCYVEEALPTLATPVRVLRLSSHAMASLVRGIEVGSGWQRQCRLWTDEDNRALVQHHYPWFLATYDAMSRNVSRADAARYLYMHRYGGGVHTCTACLCLHQCSPHATAAQACMPTWIARRCAA